VEFTSGSVHKGTVTFSNPRTAGFDYKASLCMGAAWTEMAIASFHLNAGQLKDVEFSVTMPATPGAYPVYFKVTSGGVLIGTFAATEDITVTPLYKVSVSFVRVWECEEGRMVGGVWLCTKYFHDSREATVTITNKGYPGSFTTTLEGWFYLSGEPGSLFANLSWTSTFEEGQSQIYTFKYMVPITGMPLDSRFFIKVKDPDGKIIAEVDYILPL